MIVGVKSEDKDKINVKSDKRGNPYVFTNKASLEIGEGKKQFLLSDRG